MCLRALSFFIRFGAFFIELCSLGGSGAKRTCQTSQTKTLVVVLVARIHSSGQRAFVGPPLVELGIGKHVVISILRGAAPSPPGPRAIGAIIEDPAVARERGHHTAVAVALMAALTLQRPFPYVLHDERQARSGAVHDLHHAPALNVFHRRTHGGDVARHDFAFDFMQPRGADVGFGEGAVLLNQHREVPCPRAPPSPRSYPPA